MLMLLPKMLRLCAEERQDFQRGVSIDRGTIRLKSKPMVSSIRCRAYSKTQPIAKMLMTNSRFVRGNGFAGMKRVSGSGAKRNLHDKLAAPLAELEGEKVKLLITLASEVWKRTTKSHVAESRYDNLFECGNHLVFGFAHLPNICIWPCTEVKTERTGMSRKGCLAVVILAQSGRR